MKQTNTARAQTTERKTDSGKPATMSPRDTLSSPLTLPNGVVLPNRFMKSAMSEQLGGRKFEPSKVIVRLYKEWAEGGAGLLVSGNVMVDHKHRGEPANVVVEDESNLSALKRWAAAGTSNGNHFWMQINHPGKQTPALVTPKPVAPSATALKIPGFAKPRALEEDEILEIIQRFATTASVAKKAGFTGVQIHGAHGYLVTQFLSPRHNQREDRWGGSLENRMRFVLETYKAIRKAVGPAFPVGIKLNSADFQKGGFGEDDSLIVIKALAEAGIDLIEISGGTYEALVMIGKKKASDSSAKREAYFLEFAEKVRKVTNVPLVVTGGFRSARGMAQALADGAADLVGLARPLVMHPDIPNRVFSGEDFQFKAIPKVSTGVPLVDGLFMLELAWYEQQMKRIGKGKGTKFNLNPWVACLYILMDNGLAALQPRRV